MFINSEKRLDDNDKRLLELELEKCSFINFHADNLENWAITLPILSKTQVFETLLSWEGFTFDDYFREGKILFIGLARR